MKFGAQSANFPFCHMYRNDEIIPDYCFYEQQLDFD